MKRLNAKARTIIVMAAVAISAGAAQGGPNYKYVTLNVPGSIPYTTVATSINNEYVVVGYYQDNIGTHGFTYNLKTLAWTAPIDDPNATPVGFGNTYPLTINDSGAIAGYYTYGDQWYNSGVNGMIGPPASLTDFSDGCIAEDLEPNTYITGISNDVWMVGYCNVNNGASAWIDFFSPVFFTCPSGASDDWPTAINNKGEVVGYSDNGSWVSSYGGCKTTTLINYPGTTTYLTGVNDNGIAIGFAQPANIQQTSFMLKYNISNGDMLPLPNPSGAWKVYTGQMNNNGWFVGYYIEQSSPTNLHGFFAKPI